MTPLRDVLLGDYKAKEPELAQTPEDIQRAFDAWVIATGGELGGGKKKRRRRQPSAE